MPQPRNAVVVGAGLGGMATALRLAVKGYSVTLLERGPSPGGKMNIWQQAGFTFDTGPSLITLPEVFRDLFAIAGSRLEDHLELEKLDPVARYVCADGSSFSYGQSLPHWQSEMQRLFPADIDGFHQLMSLGGRLFELSRRTFFADAPGEAADPSMLGALKHMPIGQGWGNYDATVRRFIRDERLVNFFGRYATYVGSSPYSAPATLLAIPYLEYAHGAWYFKGGLYSLVEALQNLLENAGVSIQCNSEVVRIDNQRGRVQGVELADGRCIESSIVVFNGDSAALPGLLGDTEPADLQGRSMSGIVLLLGIRGRLPLQSHHTVYFSADYRNEFQQLFGAKGSPASFPEDPTVYVNMPTASDRSLAPDDCECLFIMANCPASSNWTEEMTISARQAIFRRLRSSGFPDIMDRIAVEQVWTPATFSHCYAAPGGSIYGQDSHGWRNTFLRPANRDRRIRGLYRVGGSSHPGGGTPTVLMSAQIVSKLIERHETA